MRNDPVRRTTFLTCATGRRSANINDVAGGFSRDQRHLVMTERMGVKQNVRPLQEQPFSIRQSYSSSGPSTSLSQMQRSVLPSTSSHPRVVEPQNTLPAPPRTFQLSPTVLVIICVRPIAFRPAYEGTNFTARVGNLTIQQPSDSTLHGTYFFMR
jgi:hypothetical protein